MATLSNLSPETNVATVVLAGRSSGEEEERVVPRPPR